MQGKKRQFIFGLIGLGCGIVLSGILNLLLLLNTTEYKKGITLNASQKAQSILEGEDKETVATLPAEVEDAAEEIAQGEKVEVKKVNEQVAENKEASDNQEEAIEVKKSTDKDIVEEVTVTIPPKMTASDTCEILEAAGVIDDAKDFRDYISERKMTTKLNEGTFVLSKNMSYNELLEKLMID